MRQTLAERLPTSGLQWETQRVWRAADAQGGGEAGGVLSLGLGSGVILGRLGRLVLIQH